MKGPRSQEQSNKARAARIDPAGCISGLPLHPRDQVSFHPASPGEAGITGAHGQG